MSRLNAPSIAGHSLNVERQLSDAQTGRFGAVPALA